MSLYVDIHTHHSKECDIYLKNVLYPHRPQAEHEIISLHPWYLPESEEQALTYLRTHLSSRNILGEIGLDKVCQTPWDKQVKFFVLALTFANEMNIKAITLHSVKAHQECLKKINDVGYQGHIIFHDFFSSWEQAQELLKNPKVFFSLGKVLDRPQAKIYKSLKHIPLNRLFLETDDSKESIEERYRQFTNITAHNLEEVKKCCYDNYIKIKGEAS